MTVSMNVLRTGPHFIGGLELKNNNVLYDICRTDSNEDGVKATKTESKKITAIGTLDLRVFGTQNISNGEDFKIFTILTEGLPSYPSGTSNRNVSTSTTGLSQIKYVEDTYTPTEDNWSLDIELTIETSNNGGGGSDTKTKCGNCGGHGTVEEKGVVIDCPVCGGSGYIETPGSGIL